MRVRIIQTLTGDIDGIRLDQFRVGEVYDISTSLACYLMASGGAEPVADERPDRVIPMDEDAEDTTADDTSVKH